MTQFNDELAAIATQLRQVTVKVKSGAEGVGSGVIWDTDGLIITNAHVATSPRPTVELSDGRVFAAERLRFDPQQDLAALKITATNLCTATIADSGALRVGELVLAVGNPLGDSGAVTMGMVHQNQSQAVMADVQLYPGNSGGCLADCLGRVVGINTMIVNGLAVAIPSNTVTRFLNSRSAEDHRLQLGVRLQPVVLARRALGLLILSIFPGSIAETVGLQIGDVLIAVAGRLFTSPDDLSKYLHHSQESIPLTFVRGRRQFSVNIPRKTTVEAT